MRRAMQALLPLTFVLAACQVDVRMGDACTPGGDPTGTDGVYVVACRDGRWTPIMTVDEFVRASRGEELVIAPVPDLPPVAAPVTSTPPPTTSTSTTTSTMVSTGRFARLEGGQDHTCALSPQGTVSCWGNGGNGELGDGLESSSFVAVDVVGLGTGVTDLGVGQYHACALTAAGGVRCWGQDLGTDWWSSTHSATAVDVPGLTSGVASLDAGTTHQCVVTTAGAVECWGSNDDGQLGDGTTTASTTPVSVSGLSSEIVSVDAGASHSCAVTAAGAVKCWGANFFGQLGDGGTDPSLVPVDVVGLSGPVVQVAVLSGATCALSASGAVQCWGGNSSGLVGDGTYDDRLTPTGVVGLGSGVTALAAAQTRTCALLSSGGVRCWGLSHIGELGDGSNATSSVPLDVAGITDATSVGVGQYHACAVLVGGEARCWGYNNGGQLGDGSRNHSNVPVDVIAAA